MRCLVLGVNGQDGSYIAETLISQGHQVRGVDKQPISRYVDEGTQFSYRCVDLRRQDRLRELLEDFHPDEAYHLAAVHGPSGFNYEEVWADALDVNVKSLHTVLEYARITNRQLRIFYASSCKVFGAPLTGRISIKSTRQSTCLYSATKLCAEHLLNHYRDKHKIEGNIGYFFNHESVRRPVEFFIPKIMSILVNSMRDGKYHARVYTLDFYSDWGCAPEYMKMAVDLLRLDHRKDIIFATGKTWYGRDFVKELFMRHDLDYRKHVGELEPHQNARSFQADITDTVSHLGYRPKLDIFDACDDFLDFPPAASGPGR